MARLVGYDRFASHLPDPIAPGDLTPVEAERRLRRLLAAGLQEVCSLSWDPPRQRDLARFDSARPLANPLLADYSHHQIASSTC